jgi:hypothetical protein
MRLLLALLLAMAAVATAAPLPFPKNSGRQGEGDPAGLKAIQGAWIVTRFSGLEVNLELDGPEGPCLLAFVTGTTVEFHTKDREMKALGVTLLSSGAAGAGGGGRSRLGVYRLDRGLLLIALVPPESALPVKFEDAERAGTLWVMRRPKAR